MMRRWGPALFLALLGVGVGLAERSVVFPLVFLVLAALVSPRAFPHSLSDAAARELSASDGRPIIYWRPGCPFCMRMRAQIGRRSRHAHWVDIWSDPEGAASVRAVTGGDETVPTVVFHGEGYVNPPPARVIEMIRGAAS